MSSSSSRTPGFIAEKYYLVQFSNINDPSDITIIKTYAIDSDPSDLIVYVEDKIEQEQTIYMPIVLPDGIYCFSIVGYYDNTYNEPSNYLYGCFTHSTPSDCQYIETRDNVIYKYVYADPENLTLELVKDGKFGLSWNFKNSITRQNPDEWHIYASTDNINYTLFAEIDYHVSISGSYYYLTGSTIDKTEMWFKVIPSIESNERINNTVVTGISDALAPSTTDTYGIITEI